MPSRAYPCFLLPIWYGLLIATHTSYPQNISQDKPNQRAVRKYGEKEPVMALIFPISPPEYMDGAEPQILQKKCQND